MTTRQFKGSTNEPRAQEFLTVLLTPSRNRPLAEAIPTRVVIPGDRIPIIREAARVLKARSPLLDQEIQGYVVKLQSKDDGGGSATNSTVVDGQPRKVTMTLTEPEHKKAIRAYDQRVEILCRSRNPLQGCSNESRSTLDAR